MNVCVAVLCVAVLCVDVMCVDVVCKQESRYVFRMTEIARR